MRTIDILQTCAPLRPNVIPVIESFVRAAFSERRREDQNPSVDR